MIVHGAARATRGPSGAGRLEEPLIVTLEYHPSP